MLNLISKPVSFLSLKSLGFLLHMHHQRCYKVLALATIFENITQVKLIISNSVLFEFDRKRNKKKHDDFGSNWCRFTKKSTNLATI